MNLPGVPDSIEWPKINEFLESLGIDVSYVLREGITISWDAISCTVEAVGPHGNPYLAGDEIATHRICIPITHPEYARKD